MTDMTTIDTPFHLPLIAILRGITPDAAPAHIAALVEEGWDAIEIPLNSPDWPASIGAAVQAHGAHAWIGGGTVLAESQVDTLVRLGARLMVTPNTRPALIGYARQQGLSVVAGFASASEAFAALDAGAPLLKLFPATTYGPGHVAALRAVLPPVPLFVVGGVTSANLPAFLAAGSSGAGIGSELYRPGQPVARTRAQARAFRSVWEQSRR